MAAHGDDHHVPVHYSAGTKWSITLFAIVVAIVLGVIFVLGVLSRHKNDTALKDAVHASGVLATPVNVIRAQVAPSARDLVLPAEARAYYETTIFARTSGYLSKSLVDIGDKVTEGQLLGEIDSPEVEDQLVAAKAKVDQLNAEVKVAESAVAFSKLTFDRWDLASPNGAVSKQERDQKKAELDSNEAKLTAAKAQVALGEADVRRLTTMEKFRHVTAPFGGTITERYLDEGALVTAGSTTNTTPLFTVSQSDRIRATIEVPQAAAIDVKNGTKAIATAREFPGREFVGKVERTAEAVDPGSRTLRVEVVIPNPKTELLPGMYVQMRFQIEREVPPVRIPSGALVMRSSGPQVAVLTAGSKLSFRNITISRDMGDFVEVNDGIKPGEVLVMNVGSDMIDGQVVDARDPDGKAVGSTGATPDAITVANPAASATH